MRVELFIITATKPEAVRVTACAHSLACGSGRAAPNTNGSVATSFQLIPSGDETIRTTSSPPARAPPTARKRSPTHSTEANAEPGIESANTFVQATPSADCQITPVQESAQDCPTSTKVSAVAVRAWSWVSNIKTPSGLTGSQATPSAEAKATGFSVKGEYGRYSPTAR